MRFSPSSPPTPFSVKPKPSWIGVNSALMTMSSEKPALAVRQPRLEQPDRLERELILELQLQHARVARQLRLEPQEPAALEPAAVDRQAEAGGRLEMRRQSEQPEIAAFEREVGLEADSLHGDLQRPEAQTAADGGFDLQARVRQRSRRA